MLRINDLEKKYSNKGNIQDEENETEEKTKKKC